MLTYCSALQCNFQKEAGIIFYHPKTSRLKRAWTVRLRMGKAPSTSAVVSCKHVEKRGFVYPVYKALGETYADRIFIAFPTVFVTFTFIIGL